MLCAITSPFIHIFTTFITAVIFAYLKDFYPSYYLAMPAHDSTHAQYKWVELVQNKDAVSSAASCWLRRVQCCAELATLPQRTTERQRRLQRVI